MSTDRVGAALAYLLIVGTLPLPLLSSTPAIGVGVWVLSLAAWSANRDAIALARREPGAGSGSIEWVLPLIWLQVILDGVVPQLGTASVLFCQLAAIATLVRGSAFPTARVRR